MLLMFVEKVFPSALHALFRLDSVLTNSNHNPYVGDKETRKSCCDLKSITYFRLCACSCFKFYSPIIHFAVSFYFPASWWVEGSNHTTVKRTCTQHAADPKSAEGFGGVHRGPMVEKQYSLVQLETTRQQLTLQLCQAMFPRGLPPSLSSKP